ncbi:hypothetical protein PR048_011636 [Dryococelus australis]|uniref:Uncharacterized protein n=1 Tax=Dryococelus australis TaxID=614101 RepID=A0ABQ9HM52_9NEOP|nr:hypothetical protein PR048_011636 [Dryococelus australis]
MSKCKLNHYSTYGSDIKASVADCFNHTLKTKMWKTFIVQDTHKWINILPRLVADYDSSIHRTMVLRPTDVKDNTLLKTVQKRVISKGYAGNWSTELVSIVHIGHYSPRTYYWKISTTCLLLRRNQSHKISRYIFWLRKSYVARKETYWQDDWGNQNLKTAGQVVHAEAEASAKSTVTSPSMFEPLPSNHLDTLEYRPTGDSASWKRMGLYREVYRATCELRLAGDDTGKRALCDCILFTRKYSSCRREMYLRQLVTKAKTKVCLEERVTCGVILEIVCARWRDRLEV